jgi:hypothetical protein
LGLKSSLTERLLREAREAEAEAEADADADADVEADSDAESKAEVEPSPLHALCGLVFHLKLTAHRSGLRALQRGLAAVLPVELLPLFTPTELETLFCGTPRIDVATLQRATIYDGVSVGDRHIQFFWSAMHLMSAEERAQVVNFCSGRSRIGGSADDFPMKFRLTAPPARAADNPDRHLPTAQTCFFSLSLPMYSSLPVMLEKLRYAATQAELIDADFLMRTAAGWEDILE